MPIQPTSVVYHRDVFGRIPPGRLVYAEEGEGGVVDNYFHPLHIREALVWEMNWLLRQQVGMGLWRPRGHAEGRMQRPAEGRNVCASRWEFVSPNRMPKGLHVFPLEQLKNNVWLIRAGSCSQALYNEMNQLLLRIAGDGLWEQVWDQGPEERHGSAIPALAPSVLPLSH